MRSSLAITSPKRTIPGRGDPAAKRERAAGFEHGALDLRERGKALAARRALEFAFADQLTTQAVSSKLSAVDQHVGSTFGKTLELGMLEDEADHAIVHKRQC